MKKGKSGMRRIVALALLLAMCAALLSGCGSSRTVAGRKVEKNTLANAATYPYVVHTDSASIYLAAADIEMMGEDAFFEGLAQILPDLEADFADARELLAPWLQEPVAPIDIYTDFTGRSEMGQMGFAGGYFDGSRITLYYDWKIAGTALLHEYTHYLTMGSSNPPAWGFWAEAVADYVAYLACENRMARKADFGFDEQVIAMLTEEGGAGDDGRLDPIRVWHGYAAIFRSEESVGVSYVAVCNTVMVMTERQLEHPLMSSVSYFEASCFLGWLIDRYGMDTVFEHLDLDADGFETVYGESFEQLFAEWTVENRELCDEMGLNLPDAG